MPFVKKLPGWSEQNREPVEEAYVNEYGSLWFRPHGGKKFLYTRNGGGLIEAESNPLDFFVQPVKIVAIHVQPLSPSVRKEEAND